MTAFNLRGGQISHFHGLRGSADMFYLTGLNKPAIIVTPNPKELSSIAQRCATFKPNARIHILPPLEGAPFSFTTIHASTRRTRLLSLDAIMRDDWDYIITTPQLYLEPLPLSQKLIAPRLSFQVGDTYDLSALARSLVSMGYISVDVVNQPGDFAKRGGILDIYSFAHGKAFRLEFFDEELEEIRHLDSATQRSSGNLDDLDVLPMYEWMIGPEEAEAFSLMGGELWNQTGSRGHFLEMVSQVRDRSRFPGYLHLTSLFFSETCHFYDLIKKECIHYVIDADLIQDEMASFLSQMELQVETLSSGNQLFAPIRKVYALDKTDSPQLPETATVINHFQLQMGKIDQNFLTQSVPQYKNDTKRFLEHWEPQAKRQAIVIVCHNASLLHKMEESLEEDGHHSTSIQFPLSTPLNPGFHLAIGSLDTGFSWPDEKLVVFSEQDIWSKTGKTRRPQPSGKTIFQSEFRDLKIGDYVVHLDHGIGRFLGLIEMEAGGARHEMMALEYRDKQKLYVHLNQLDLVQRFGSENTSVQLDKMGGVAWTKAKARVKKAVREMAAELLKLYASRRLAQGQVYGPDTEWQREFEEQFEHEPTEGQLRAVADIKADLGKPMDRLLVGDVGFGKTEVAMRMAFKVALEGRQVAVLCPTTVLAFQHYHTFKNRFRNFPVNIRWVSRFSSTTHIKKCLKETANGVVDILIGTHRILSKDVQFKNLSALIIDEEQRFGVSHKEKLKQMRKQVDVLSMSATPIPRTLNMALTGIRDISVIESPPRNRLAISTMVAESREGLIRNAINFELDRGGQVFFIHNRVETMQQVAVNIKKLVPNATIAQAHGQMDSKRLEKVMLDFMNQKVDILVASTIIENGVDIPNANTMIVNRADMFGMSQLYQLRGRIGRSDKPAYAYLLAPERSRMTQLARKRLAALEEFSDLGSGFRIAAMDLELRGAGNMLGGEQAGHINAIGYDLYIKLLEEAVNELKGQPIEDQIHCNLNLGFGAALPRSYIEDTNQRLSYYKKLASAKDESVLTLLRETLQDCYGDLPLVADQLCLEQELRLYLSKNRILQVEREKDKLRIRFHPEAQVNPEIVLTWIQEDPEISLTPEGVLSLPLKSRDPNHVMNFIRTTVHKLVG